MAPMDSSPILSSGSPLPQPLLQPLSSFKDELLLAVDYVRELGHEGDAGDLFLEKSDFNSLKAEIESNGQLESLDGPHKEKLFIITAMALTHNDLFCVAHRISRELAKDMLRQLHGALPRRLEDWTLNVPARYRTLQFWLCQADRLFNDSPFLQRSDLASGAIIPGTAEDPSASSIRAPSVKEEALELDERSLSHAVRGLAAQTNRSVATEAPISSPPVSRPPADNDAALWRQSLQNSRKRAPLNGNAALSLIRQARLQENFSSKEQEVLIDTLVSAYLIILSIESAHKGSVEVLKSESFLAFDAEAFDLTTEKMDRLFALLMDLERSGEAVSLKKVAEAEWLMKVVSPYLKPFLDEASLRSMEEMMGWLGETVRLKAYPGAPLTVDLSLVLTWSALAQKLQESPLSFKTMATRLRVDLEMGLSSALISQSGRKDWEHVDHALRIFRLFSRPLLWHVDDGLKGPLDDSVAWVAERIAGGETRNVSSSGFLKWFRPVSWKEGRALKAHPALIVISPNERAVHGVSARIREWDLIKKKEMLARVQPGADKRYDPLLQSKRRFIFNVVHQIVSEKTGMDFSEDRLAVLLATGEMTYSRNGRAHRLMGSFADAEQSLFLGHLRREFRIDPAGAHGVGLFSTRRFPHPEEIFGMQGRVSSIPSESPSPSYPRNVIDFLRSHNAPAVAERLRRLPPERLEYFRPRLLNALRRKSVTEIMSFLQMDPEPTFLGRLSQRYGELPLGRNLLALRTLWKK